MDLGEAKQNSKKRFQRLKRILFDSLFDKFGQRKLAVIANHLPERYIHQIHDSWKYYLIRQVMNMKW